MISNFIFYFRNQNKKLPSFKRRRVKKTSKLGLKVSEELGMCDVTQHSNVSHFTSK